MRAASHKPLFIAIDATPGTLFHCGLNPTGSVANTSPEFMTVFFNIDPHT